MKVVTRYQADDGSLWDSAADAAKRDAIYADCLDAAKLLKPPVGNRRGYVQQDPAAVLAYKTRLLQIAATVGICHAGIEPSRVLPNGIIGRTIDDSGINCLSRAWWRLQSTDDNGREWGQPYFAIHPSTGPDIAL